MTTTPEASRLAEELKDALRFTGIKEPGSVHGLIDALAALSQPDEARDARWQPIETCPETGFFLVTEDTAVRALFRYKGKWESPDFPAIQDEWGDLIVGDDAKRLTGGRPLVVSQGVREPTHWMEVPTGVARPDEDDAAMSKEQP